MSNGKLGALAQLGLARILVVALTIVFGSAASAAAEPAPIKIAMEASMTGSGNFYGDPTVDGVRLAAEEAAEREGAPVEISVSMTRARLRSPPTSPASSRTATPWRSSARRSPSAA